MGRQLLAGMLAAWAAWASVGAQGTAYDIVYVRAPRYGDTVNTKWPEVFNPFRMDPGADLMLLHPDGTEEVLVDAGPSGAVLDPCVSFDGEWVYYSLVPDATLTYTFFHTGLARSGADIYKIHVPTRQVVRLTFQEATPNTAVSLPALNYGVYNLGACPVSGGKVVFTSTRDHLIPTKGFTPLTAQLYVMDEDGANVTRIAPMSLGSTLHPFQLTDGRIVFSSYESQGLRDSRLWGLWAIWPDGRQWEPLMSAFAQQTSFHFQTQLADGRIAFIPYYNANNNGFGSLYAFPAQSPTAPVKFGSPLRDLNPGLPYYNSQGLALTERYSFSPVGLETLAPFSTPHDHAAKVGGDGVRVGKFTHPSGAPGNDLLVVWSPGPANNLQRPTNLPFYDGGIYLARGGAALSDPAELVLVKNDPAYSEQWPRALVPYRAIYGVDEPHEFPWLPNAGSLHLPAGTPYGIVGTSSLYKRESAPGYFRNTCDNLDCFLNDNTNSSNWYFQGSDVGRYSNSEIWGIRIVTFEPTSQGKRQWYNHARERTRILGEIPVRKGATVDPEGNPDTSWSAKLPADTPFTFHLIDSRGRNLAVAQTWHQVRPGEIRTNCGGCHAHSVAPLAFEQTAAAALPPVDLTTAQPRDVEFVRDIRPLLQAKCVGCHTGGDAAPARLDLSAQTLAVVNTGEPALPEDYRRLAHDERGEYGIPSWDGSYGWQFSNQASRYIRKFQSRRSLLVWKLEGARLDGWTNDSWPSEAVPGDPTTIVGDVSKADLDYHDTAGHHLLLTAAEKRLVSTWIDIGAPVDAGEHFADELRPTLTVSHPRPNRNTAAVTEVRVGVADVGSGLNLTSLLVEGLPVGARVQVAPGVFVFPLTAPVTTGTHVVTVSVRDLAGNLTRQAVRFWVEGDPPPPPQELCGPDGFGNGLDDDGDGQIDEVPPCAVPPSTDVTAPTVTLAVTRNGRSHNYEVVSTAADNVGVVQHRVFVNGHPADATVFTVALKQAGTYTFTAEAQDAAGNVGQAGPITVVR